MLEYKIGRSPKCFRYIIREFKNHLRNPSVILREEPLPATYPQFLLQPPPRTFLPLNHPTFHHPGNARLNHQDQPPLLRALRPVAVLISFPSTLIQDTVSRQRQGTADRNAPSPAQPTPSPPYPPISLLPEKHRIERIRHQGFMRCGYF